MTVLAVPATSVAAFFVAVAIASRIHETFKDRWSEKRIDLFSAAVCLVLLGAPAYTMLALGGCLPVHALMLHLGIGCFYAFVVLTGVGNYIEGFVLATIVCLLLLFLIPVGTKLRSIDHSHGSTSAPIFSQLFGHLSRDILCVTDLKCRAVAPTTAYQIGEREGSAQSVLESGSSPRPPLPLRSRAPSFPRQHAIGDDYFRAFS